VVAAGIPPLTYQWQKNGVDIEGATGPLLNIPAAIVPDSGATFGVIVTDRAGSVASRRAALTVLPAPGSPVILTNPERARILAGERASFSVKASSALPMSYQWQMGTSRGNMSDIPGATQAIYTTPPARSADSLTLFRCVVSNAAGNATSASEMLMVSAAAKP
jgi:hypothetical protein